MNITFQGTVNMYATTKITCSGSSLSINNIIINNPTNVPYTVTVNVFSAKSNITTLIYTFDLDAGDTLRDTELYVLGTGDYMQILSSAPGTTFYVSANQI